MPGRDLEDLRQVAFQAICTNPACGFTGEAQPTYDAACDDADDHTATC